MTKERATNPKDLIGASKPNLGLIPPTALPHISMALMYGAFKYGPYNWRNEDKKVGVMTYCAAAKRHIDSYIDGEDVASDSLVNHLAHAAAGIMIVIDAIENGFAIDDRPEKGHAGKVYDRLQAQYKEEMLPLWKKIKEEQETPKNGTV